MGRKKISPLLSIAVWSGEKGTGHHFQGENEKRPPGPLVLGGTFFLGDGEDKKGKTRRGGRRRLRELVGRRGKLVEVGRGESKKKKGQEKKGNFSDLEDSLKDLKELRLCRTEGPLALAESSRGKSSRRRKGEKNTFLMKYINPDLSLHLTRLLTTAKHPRPADASQLACP